MNIGINLSITGTIVLNPPVSEPAEELGPELVTDGPGGAWIGNFSDTAGFTIAAGPAWTIAEGVATADQFNDGNMTVTTPNEAIEVGRTYRVTFTIASISTGSVQPRGLGAVGTSRSVPGTYTEDIVAATTASPSLFNSASDAVIDDWHVNEVL